MRSVLASRPVARAKSRACAWGLPPRSAAPRRPKPRPRAVRSPRWPPGSPGQEAPLGGEPGAFVCRRGRWRRRRYARLRPPPGRATRRPLGAPWRGPLPRKPPCAHGPYVAPPWSVVVRPCGCGLSPRLSGGGPGNCSGSLYQKGARRPYSFLRSFWTRAGAGLSRPPGRFYDR
jgi:hypothetical protein